MDGGETLVPDKMRLVKPWKTEPRSKSPFTTKDNSFARKDLKDDDGVVTHELHQGILKSLQPKLVAWSRMRVWRGVLQPKDGKEIPFLILISFLATFAGIPVSTTHTITGSIMGVGATRRLSAVRWGIVNSILLAWLLTIPAAAAMASISYLIIRLFSF